MKHTALAEPKPSQAFRNKYLAAIMAVAALLICAVTSAQTTDSLKYSQINGYGFKYKRMAFDSTLMIPLSTSPHSPYRMGALRYRASDSTLQLWTGYQWNSIVTGVGNGVDTAYVYDDSTIAIETPDADYFVKIVGRHWTLQQVLNNGSALTENENITLADSLEFTSGWVIIDSLRLRSLQTTTDTSTHKPIAVDGSGNVVKMSSWLGGGGGITQLTGDGTAGPGSGSQALTISTNAVTNSKIRQSAGRSIIGRSANSTGNVADITSTTPYRFLGDNGTSLGYNRPFNIIDVREYGVVGDNSTDNTTALQNLFNNVSAGDAVYFPPGRYVIAGTVYLKKANVTLMGSNSNMSYDYVAGAVDSTGSILVGTSTTNNMLVDSAVGIHMERLSFINTSGAPTAGAGVKLANGGWFTMKNCNFRNFYNNMEVYNSAIWSITDCKFINPKSYGLYIENVVNPDAGDQSIIGTNFIATDTSATLIRQRSGGGLKIANCKFNSYNGGVGPYPKICLDLNITGATAVLTVIGNSFENFRDYGVLILGNGATFEGIVISDNHFSAYHEINGNFIGIGTNVSKGLIEGNVFVGAPAADCINLDGSTNIDVGINHWQPLYQNRIRGYFPLHASKGIMMDAMPTPTSDINVMTNYNDSSTIGMTAGPLPKYDATNGPGIGFRGNTYNKNAGQRGDVFLFAGNPSSPTSDDGTIRFFTGATAERGRWNYGGEFQIGSTTDLGSSKLQVTGTIQMQDGNQGNGKVLTSDANGVGTWQSTSTYQVYTALLSQSGTSDPTATVLGNNTVGSIVWTRNSTGNYTGTLTGAFTANKTWLLCAKGDGSGSFVNGLLYRTGNNTVVLDVRDNNATLTDSYTNMSLEIRVYP